MGRPTVYVDVDGTLTQVQCGRSAFKVPPRQDIIDKVKELSKTCDIVIWTGNTEYAKKVAKLYDIPAIACIAKPTIMVDNEYDKFKRRLRRKVITPEVFLSWEPDDKQAMQVVPVS